MNEAGANQRGPRNRMGGGPPGGKGMGTPSRPIRERRGVEAQSVNPSAFYWTNKKPETAVATTNTTGHFIACPTCKLE